VTGKLNQVADLTLSSVCSIDGLRVLDVPGPLDRVCSRLSIGIPSDVAASAAEAFSVVTVFAACSCQY